MSDKVVSMLPIAGNLTAELLDEFDPDFVKWMLASLAAKGGEDVHTVRHAIANSEHFKKTMNAALASVEQTNAAFGEGKGPGEVSLVILLLIAGWKLCERQMQKLAESSAVT